MIFNDRYKLSKTFAPVSQEEIFNCPEYYAMSLDDILYHKDCSDFLKNILYGFPWKNRAQVIQVRPQDFRTGKPHVLGDGWHCDINTTLANGRIHSPKDLDEFRMMTVSFGDVAETELIKDPIEIDDVSPYEFHSFYNKVSLMKFETVTAAPNQLVDYSSTDIHRINPNYRIGKMRLIIVAFECDDPIEKEGGRVGPSIRERNGK